MMKNLILIKLKLIAVFVCFSKDSLDKDLFNKCKKLNIILVISTLLNIFWVTYLKQKKL